MRIITAIVAKLILNPGRALPHFFLLVIPKIQDELYQPFVRPADHPAQFLARLRSLKVVRITSDGE